MLMGWKKPGSEVICEGPSTLWILEEGMGPIQKADVGVMGQASL